MASGRRGVLSAPARRPASSETKNLAQCTGNEDANLHKMEDSPAKGRTRTQEHALIVQEITKTYSGSAPLMLSGVPGRKIGANATTIVRQREARCHGGQGKESASLQSMEDKIVRFLRARQRKTINFCTKSSKIVVTFQHVPDLLLLVPGASGQLVGVPAILRVQTHLKEAGSEPAKKPHFQLMKD